MPKPLKFILILLLLVPPFLGFGQEQSVLETFEKEIPFLVFKTQDATLNFQQVLASPDLFKSPNAFKEKTQSEDIYWIQLDFENLLSNESEAKDFYLKLNIFDYGSVFYQIDGATTEKPIGQFEESNITKKIGTSYYYSFITLSTKNLIEDRYLLIKAQRITFNEDVNNWHFKRCISPPNEYMTTKDFFKQVIYYFFAGLCFIMWFSTLSFFLLLRNREYLYYSIYIVVTFIYLAGNKFGIYDLFLGNSYLKHNLSQSFLILGNLSYVLFVMSYLRTKRDYPGIHKVCKILVVLNIATLVLIGVFYSVDTVSIVMYSYEFTCAIALIAIIYLFLTSKNLLGRIIALASFAYSMGPLLRIYFVEPEDGLYLDGTYYLILGVSLEMVIFVFGLNYKFHLELRENFQLQQEAFVSKTKALRAQINPHFIFNSLSSIKHLVLQKDNKNAVKYLSKFGRLSRNILESSIGTNATLSEEVKMLEDYLELESLRFDNAFSYSIKVDDTLNTSIIELPSMILQPFVENAIVHGLLPKEGTDKKLSINFMLDGNELVSVVEDNGVGRKQAIQRKHIYQKEKKSRGLEITKLRLESIVNDQDYLQIIDKVDNNNAPLGTKVVIKIPL
ncbi:sensor histidine kinase [Flagellimonas eckloniae]|uniref:sensor histidine kinase n=1 Tax=Flagellimonas eckloniae TaxID=346185 RepID=UPI0006DC6754|nr:histidine kinase [Allomuricauda eckloniae]